MHIALQGPRPGNHSLLISSLALLAGLGLGCGSDLTLPGPGEPASLVAVSGDGQNAATATWLSKPLVVKVLDSSGHPLEGIRIQYHFADRAAGAALDPQVAESDAGGLVSANVRLGSAGGE